MSNLPLENELRRALVEVQRQIEVITNEAGNRGFHVSEMRNSDGTWPMIPLLNAKAQILNGLAVVRSKRS